MAHRGADWGDWCAFVHGEDATGRISRGTASFVDLWHHSDSGTVDAGLGRAGTAAEKDFASLVVWSGGAGLSRDCSRSRRRMCLLDWFTAHPGLGRGCLDGSGVCLDAQERADAWRSTDGAELRAEGECAHPCTIGAR